MSIGWIQSGRRILAPDGSLITSNLCPCPAQWYIATYCPCTQCGTPPCRVGEPFTIDANPVMLNEYALRGIEIEEHSDGTFPYHIDDSPYVCAKDCYVVAVKHTARAAPFAGIITATVSMTGKTPVVWSRAVDAEEVVEIGDDTLWDGGPGYGETTYAAIATYFHITTAGVHAVNLAIEFSAEGQDTVRYTCRKCIRVYEPEQETPFVGDVFIVPDWYIGQWTACVAETTLGARLSISTLLGPFATEAAALAELEGPHAEIIAEWAEKCQCPRCEFVRDGFWQHEESDSGADYWVYDVCTTAGQDCAPGTGLNCWIKLTYSVQNWGDGWTVELKINGVDMGVEDGNTYTFYVPPCSTVEERLHVVGSGDIMVGFYAEELGQPDPCPYDKEAYPTLAEYLESLEA